MATPIDKEAAELLRGLRSGAGTPIDPEARKILQGMRAEVERMKPPPPPPPTVIFEPPPYQPRNPTGPTGRVIDPVSGKEFPRPGQGGVETAPQPMDTRALEQGLQTVQELPFKALSVFRDPATSVLNNLSDKVTAGYEREGPMGALTGALDALGEAPQKAKEGFLSPRPVPSTFLSKPLKKAGVNPWLAEGAQFVVDTFAGDPLHARMWGGLMGFMGKGTMAGLRKAGALDVTTPGVGKSANTLKAEREVQDIIKQYGVRGDAARNQLLREGAQVTKRLEEIWKKYPNAQIARQTADGRRVNLADELTTDWIEAGLDKARYRTRGEVERIAQQQGVDVKDLREAGNLISTTYQKSGRWLEEIGFLKPGTVDAYGGRYATQMYHFASHNPTDIQAAMRAAKELDAVAPEALDLGNKILRQVQQGRGTGFSTGKERQGLSALDRELMGQERQAGVVFSASIGKQASVGSKFQALKDISDNPDLFIPLSRAETRAGQVAPEAAEQLAGGARLAQQTQRQAVQALEQFEQEVLERASQRAQAATAELAKAEQQLAARGGWRGVPLKERPTLRKNIERLRAQSKVYQGEVSVEKALQNLYRPGDREAFRQRWLTLKAEAREAQRTSKSALQETGRAQRGTIPTTSQVPNEAPEGWVRAKFGPHEGYWHPVAAQALDEMTQSKNIPPAMKALDNIVASMAGAVRRYWAGYNPVTQLRNIPQNLAMAEGAAAARGIHYDASHAMRDIPLFWKAARGEVRDQFFDEYAARSRAFGGSSTQLGEIGRSLRTSIGIDTPGQKIKKGVEALREAPLKAFGGVEQLFKYSLFKRLRQSGIGADDAARITDKALFDHEDTNAIAYALNRWGFIPFAGTRSKALLNNIQIYMKNPDILYRYSGLPLRDRLTGVAGEEAEARAQVPDPYGRLRIPVPGMRDQYGRQQFVSGGPLSILPFEGLEPGQSKPGGIAENIISNLNPFAGSVFQPLINIGQNYDPYFGRPIVEEGSRPNEDVRRTYIEYLARAYLPGPIGRGIPRIKSAVDEQPQFASAGQEPETLVQALAAVGTGVRTLVPEGDAERMARVNANRIRRGMPNYRFLSDYETQVQRGSVRRQTFPELGWINSAEKARQTAELARKTLKRLAEGKEAKSVQEQGALRRQWDWVMALKEKQIQLTQQGSQIQQRINQARAE